MADTDGHRGWKNYPTWVVRTWLDDDPITYHGVREQALSIATDVTVSTGAKIEAFATSLREYVADDTNPITEAGSMHSDLLGWAIGQVAWDDIARSIMAEALTEEARA